MGLGDIRYTVLQTVQEVFRKLGLNQPASPSENKLSIQMVDFINDVCDEMSDYGDWVEALTTANVTCVSGQTDYSVSTSANIKNIGDIFFSQRRGPLRDITPHDMRILTRSTIVGQPTQFAVMATDTNGNPVFRVRPVPGMNEDGGLFSVLYFIRAPRYTTADGASVIPYPARIVVLGTLAKQILNESGGEPTDRYTVTYQQYLTARKEALNRFNGDTGFDVSMTPSLIGRRRR